MGVRLELERFTETDLEILYNKMAAQIKSLCESGVDGIFVTIPDRQSVRDAIKICQVLNIPVIAVNSDPRISEEVGVLQHIGQDEVGAGYLAGTRMMEAGMKEGYCSALEGNSGSTARCTGFVRAIESAGLKGTLVNAPVDMSSQLTQLMEDAVGKDDNWEGVGWLIGASQLEATLAVQERRKGLLIGMFDLGKFAELIFSALDDGKLLFTSDQQPYLQGNLPVYLLTYIAYTQQRLLDKVILTGPSLITSRPTADQQICEKNLYQVCAIIPEEDLNFISPGWLGVGYFFCAITVFTGLLCLGWMFVFRGKKVVRASQPPFLVMLVIGAILSSCAIIPMGTETNYRISTDPFSGATIGSNPDIDKVDAACMAVPWLYGIGFSLVYAALFSKIWRVKLLFQAALEMRRRAVGYKDVMFVLVAMLFVELALLVAWQVASPHRWEREVTLESAEGYVLESVGKCESDSGWYFMATIVGFHIFCLFYALILCWQAKHIPSEFADSNSVSLSVIMVFQISILAIPIAAMVQDETDVFYFVRACALFLQSFTVLCLIFLPKMYKTFQGDDEIRVSTIRRRPGNISGLSQEWNDSAQMSGSGFPSETEVTPLKSPCCHSEIVKLCSSCGTPVFANASDGTRRQPPKSGKEEDSSKLQPKSCASIREENENDDEDDDDAKDSQVEVAPEGVATETPPSK